MIPANDASSPWHKRLLYALTNWGLFTAGVINLFIGTRSALNQSSTIAVTCITAGLVLLFAATIDRFESLKGLGVEAKTRQLDRKIEEADDALTRLRQLAEVTCAALVDLYSKMDRWDSVPTPAESYALAQKVRSIMAALGSDAESIDLALNPAVRVLCFDLATALTAPIRQAVSDVITKLNRERSSIPQPVNPMDPEFLRLTTSINAANGYVSDRLNKMHGWGPDDYPERLLGVFNDVPLVDALTVA